MAMDFTGTLNALRSFVQSEPVVAVLVVLVVILIVFTILLSMRISRLTRGGDGKTLEGTIKALGDRTSALESYARKNQAAVNNIEVRLARAIQGVAVERFDPFKNAGGQQSFTTAFLNEHGDGVIVSGIHSRDQVRVYAKPIKQFKSEHELSEEESQAIANAKQKVDK